MALIEFYGQECPHCVRMKPLVQRLQKEEGVTVESLEVWHNPEHQARMDAFDKNKCGGVPFFYNTNSKKFLCGEVPYEELRAWALK